MFKLFRIPSRNGLVPLSALKDKPPVSVLPPRLPGQNYQALQFQASGGRIVAANVVAGRPTEK